MYLDRKQYAFSLKELQEMCKTLLPVVVQKVRANPQSYGFAANEITDDAYFGQNFTPGLLAQDKYITTDPSVQYFPLCRKQKILGILTVKKDVAGLSLSLNKDYADHMTKLLVSSESYQLMNYNGNLLACHEISAELSGSTQAMTLKQREGILIKQTDSSFNTKDITDTQYKLVLDSAVPESKWSGRLINPLFKLNGDGNISSLVWLLNSQPVGDFSGKTYYLKNSYSGLNLQVNGTVVTQGKFTGQTNQQFTMTEVGTRNGNKVYSIIPKSSGFDMRLDIVNASLRNGAKVQVFKNNPAYATAQQFEVCVENGNVCCFFSCLSSDTTKCLEIVGPSTSDGQSHSYGIRYLVQTNNGSLRW